MPSVDPALLSDARALAAYLIFFGSYFVFALGTFPWMKIDRPGAAIIGGVHPQNMLIGSLSGIGSGLSAPTSPQEASRRRGGRAWTANLLHPVAAALNICRDVIASYMARSVMKRGG